MDIFDFFNELLSTQNVDVDRFARNVEGDFFCDFQTLCKTYYSSFMLHLSFFMPHEYTNTNLCQFYEY